MKNKLKLVVVLIFVLVLSGAIVVKTEDEYSLPPALVKTDLEMEESLDYEWFAEQISQLERAQAQELFDAAKALRGRLEVELGAVQAQIGKEILNLQLQLVLVSLDGQEQLVILDRIDHLQKELENWQEQAQVEYEQGLAQLQLDHQVKLQKALAVLTSP